MAVKGYSENILWFRRRHRLKVCPNKVLVLQHYILCCHHDGNKLIDLNSEKFYSTYSLNKFECKNKIICFDSDLWIFPSIN